VTLKTGVMMLKIQLCITGISYFTIYIKMYQINAALVSISDFFIKNKNSMYLPN